MTSLKALLPGLLLLVATALFARGTHEPGFTDWDFSSRYQMGPYSVRVAMKGDIELSRDDSQIVSMGPNALLYIYEARTFQNVELIADNDGRGNADYSLWVNGAKRNIRANERRIIAELLQRAAEDFGVGAMAKMERLYREKGIRAVVSVIRPVRSAGVQVHLFETFAKRHSLNRTDSIEFAEATDAIPGSSGMRDLIESLAGELHGDDTVTVALLRAAASIQSSNDKRDAVIAVASIRKLKTDSRIEMADTIKTIHSSSDKREALVYLSRHLNGDEKAFDACLEAANGIVSSDDKARVLLKLLEAGLPTNLYDDFFRTVRNIPSSSDKGEVLEESSRYLPADEDVWTYYLDTAATIPSSSEKVRVLVAAAEEDNFPPSVVREYLSVVRTIPSSDDSVRALKALRSVEIEDDDFADLFRIVDSIPSSSDKREALEDMLAFPRDIPVSSLLHYARAAKKIPSSSDKRVSLISLLRYVDDRGGRYTRNDALKDEIQRAIASIPANDDREQCMEKYNEVY